MKAFNHVAGGVVFTGLFSSMADVNIFESIQSTLTVLLFTQLPDVDHKKALIGRAVPPVSTYLQKNFGHRTITHSIFALFLVIVLMRLIDFAFGSNLTLIASLAFASHLIFDMCTRAGIQFFYPFSKKPAVLPANPNLRIQTNDLRTEVIVFSIFMCLNFTMLPLFASGFWTKYNQFFMTFDHLIRETKEKPGIYQVEFLNDRKEKIKALLLEGEESKIIVLENQKIKEYETEKLKLETFLKTKIEKQKEEINLSGLNYQQLKELSKLNILVGKIQSNEDFRISEKTIQKDLKYYEFKYEFPKLDLISKKDSSGVEIAKLEIQKEVRIRQFKEETQRFERQKAILKSQVTEGKSSLEIQKNREILKNLEMLEIQKPIFPDLSILDFQIQNLTHSDQEPQIFNISFEIIRLKSDTSKPQK